MVQTISYLPHFLSWVVVASLIRPLLASSGPLNLLAAALGLETPILFLQRPGTFLAIVLVSDIWKGVGWGSIIYLAAISGIDPSLYESAEIDGAGRIQQMRFITLPSITFVIVIMFLLQLGNILELGFDQIFNLIPSAGVRRRRHHRHLRVPRRPAGLPLQLRHRGRPVPEPGRAGRPGGRQLVHQAPRPGGRVHVDMRTPARALPGGGTDFEAVALRLFTGAVMILFTVSILYPFWYLLVDSFNTPPASVQDRIKLWPLEFTLDNYAIVPLSAPVVATVALWAAVAHWNDWFFPLIFTPEKRLSVLQVLLRRVLLENQVTTQMEILPEDEIWMITPEPLKAALLFVSVGPIVAVYPFLQRYFVKGIMLGSVKG